MRSIASITRLIIADAFANKASDIHLDPTPLLTTVRLRIHGNLLSAYSLPAECHPELISRLKILSRLRIDEHICPQDGRFTFRVPDSSTEFDVRVSILPANYGESAVMRLLTPFNEQISLTNLGLTDDYRQAIQIALAQPHGMIVVVGPTGSGKTTTVYAFIRELLETQRLIVSIEDPIEYSIPGVRQIQVQPEHGLSFAEGLRALLRQDPDVIVVGEIRDAETANLAVQAAHTGHLVLSTLHAIGVHEAFARLGELGVAHQRLAAIQITIIGQRLARDADGEGRHGEFTLLHA